MAGLALKTGAALAGQAGSSALGLVFQDAANRNNYKWGEKAANSDYARQMQMYERQYKDSSPLNVANQLAEAGLNKGLMFSGGAGGVGGAAKGATAPTNKMSNAQAMGGQNLAVTMAQMENIKAQTDLTRAQEDKTKAETPNVGKTGVLIDEDVLNRRQQRSLMEAQTEAEKLNNQLKAGRMSADIESAYAQLYNAWAGYENVIADTKKKGAETETIEQSRNAQIGETLSRMALNKAQASLTGEQEAKVIEEVKTIVPYLEQLKIQVANGTITAEAAKSQAQTRIDQLDWDKMTFGVKTVVEGLGNIVGQFIQYGTKSTTTKTKDARGNTTIETGRKWSK